MGWSLRPDALRPLKIYCASPSITSQLILFLWQTVDISPLGHVRVVEVLQTFVQKCDPVTFSGIHIHIAGVQQFHCRWDTVYIIIYSFYYLNELKCNIMNLLYFLEEKCKYFLTYYSSTSRLKKGGENSCIFEKRSADIIFRSVGSMDYYRLLLLSTSSYCFCRSVAEI